MTVRVLTSLDEAEKVAGAWANLADTTTARAFTHPSWCLPWWRELGRGQLLVVTVERGGDLVALAPLHVRRYPGLQVARFLGHGLGAVSEVLVAPGHEDAEEELWAGVRDGGRRQLDLVEYRDGGGGLSGVDAGGPIATVEPRDVCSVVPLAGTPEAWWSTAHKELRRIFRRAERQLAEAGVEHRTEIVTEPERVREVLPELIAVHDAAEAANPRQHLLAPPWVAFTTSLLHHAATAGRLRLLVGRADGQASSFMLLLAGGGAHAMWLNRFDPAFARFSPGHLTLRAALEDGFETGAHELDLLIGPNRYKNLWATETYRTFTVRAASSSARRRAGDAVRRLLNMARQRVPRR